jgi:hypothetical protein
VARKQRRISPGRSPKPRAKGWRPRTNRAREGSRSRSESPLEWREPPEAKGGGAGNFKEEGKVGSSKEASRSKEEGDSFEAHANQGYYSKAGGVATFEETRAGIRREDGSRPPVEAVEWLEVQAKNHKCHKFSQLHHYPRPRWPEAYYDDGGEPCCPPRVEGPAKDLFTNAKGLIFNYLDRDYRFLGKNPGNPCKPQWEPFPFPGKDERGAAPTGKGKNKGGKHKARQRRQDMEGCEEEYRPGKGGRGGSKSWFT